MESFNWLLLFGGLAFFFFGLNSAKHGLRLAAGDKLRHLLAKVTNNRIMAIFFGAFITFVLQSSTATTVLLVSFADTQFITLTQAIGLTLGADIGTTFVAILLSLKSVTEYSLLLVVVGVFLDMISTKRKSMRHAGLIIMGFGIIFYGMHMMSQAALPLKDNPIAALTFEFLATHPFWNLIFAALFTALIHTSAVTIGLAIALSFAGVLTFETSIPIVLGANIGTCITAVLASFTTGVNGKRVAFAHVMIKVVAVTAVFPFMGHYAELISKIISYMKFYFPAVSESVAVKIALTHLVFNILLVIVFLPFVKVFARLVEKAIPAPLPTEEAFAPKYLDEGALDTPSLAFAQAKREIMRIAKLSKQLSSTALMIFSKSSNFDEERERIGTLDDKIDILEKAVRFYLAKISQKSLTEEQVHTQMALFTIAEELEAIGDIISKDMLILAEKKSKKMHLFSDEGWHELRKFHALVEGNFDLMISMLSQPHKDIAMKIERHEDYMNTVEQELRQSHLNRLHQGLSETFETSSIHLDILGNLRMINTKVTKIAKTAELI